MVLKIKKTLCGVEHDENRKTTQNIVDFLRDKPFHGDFRPLVQIVNIVLNERVLDVMLVFATKNVPYVLKKIFKTFELIIYILELAIVILLKTGVLIGFYKKNYGVDILDLIYLH